MKVFAGSAAIGRALNRLGVHTWFRYGAGSSYTEDPWVAFRLARESASPGHSALKDVTDLFVRDCALKESSLRAAIGNSATRWLLSQGVVRSVGGGKVQSKYCLLSCFGYYLFIHWPTEAPSGSLVSIDTYLGKSSYDCAHEVLRRRPQGRTLDLGCGSGLIAILLAAFSRRAVAIDIDDSALDLTRLNLAINGLEADLVQCDLADCLSPVSHFDFILVNPPWRMIPTGIAYPNPTARVGLGVDGLDQVRQILRRVPGILTDGGEAFVRFDISSNPTGVELALRDFKAAVGPDFSGEARLIGFTSVAEQAKISADTCQYLNKEVANLEELFRERYNALGVREIAQINYFIRHKRNQVASHDAEPARRDLSISGIL